MSASRTGNEQGKGVCAYLPSATIYVMSHDITGFTYRGLTPPKITPMPGVHRGVEKDAETRCGHVGQGF